MLVDILIVGARPLNNGEGLSSVGRIRSRGPGSGAAPLATPASREGFSSSTQGIQSAYLIDSHYRSTPGRVYEVPGSRGHDHHVEIRFEALGRTFTQMLESTCIC
jgi:hypothetical protein